MKILPSDPFYKEINNIFNLYAIAKNPQMYFWGEDRMDVDDYMRNCIVSDLEENIRVLLED